MARPEIRYYKARQKRLAMTTIEHTDGEIETEVILYTNTSRKSSFKKIPIIARIHPLALLELTEIKDNFIMRVAMRLITYLSKENPSTVQIRIGVILEDLQISDKSLTKTLNLLETLGYIKALGGFRFRISPNLAFYGSDSEWSLAMELEDKAVSPEEIAKAISKMNSDFAELEILAGTRQITDYN